MSRGNNISLASVSKPTWDEPLVSVHGVVAHTVVSTGEHHGLLVEETHIVPHSSPQAEDEVGLSNYSGHGSASLLQDELENYESSDGCFTNTRV